MKRRLRGLSLPTYLWNHLTLRSTEDAHVNLTLSSTLWQFICYLFYLIPADRLHHDHANRLAHNLKLVLWRPTYLRKAQTTFDTLKIFARSFITQNMSLLVTLMEFLARGSLVNTNHGHTNGPGTAI